MIRTRSLRLRVQEIPEHVIQTRIMQLLHSCGWLVVRINSGRMKGPDGKSYFKAYSIYALVEKYAHEGFPDLVAFKGSRFLLIEVKKPSGRLRESQKRFIEMAKRFGVKVYICRSWEEARDVVEEFTSLVKSRPTREQIKRWKMIESAAQEIYSLLRAGQAVTIDSLEEDNLGLALNGATIDK